MQPMMRSTNFRHPSKWITNCKSLEFQGIGCNCWSRSSNEKKKLMYLFSVIEWLLDGSIIGDFIPSLYSWNITEYYFHASKSTSQRVAPNSRWLRMSAGSTTKIRPTRSPWQKVGSLVSDLGVVRLTGWVDAQPFFFKWVKKICWVKVGWRWPKFQWLQNVLPIQSRCLCKWLKKVIIFWRPVLLLSKCAKKLLAPY